MRLQSFMEEAGKGSCLAIDYIYIALAIVNPDFETMDDIDKDVAIFQCLELAVLNKYVDEDFYVPNAPKLMNYLTGKKVNVYKMEINGCTELPLNKWSAVGFDYNSKRHFVVGFGTKIIYDSLDNSNCRKYGKPTTARIVEVVNE